MVMVSTAVICIEMRSAHQSMLRRRVAQEGDHTQFTWLLFMHHLLKDSNITSHQDLCNRSLLSVHMLRIISGTELLASHRLLDSVPLHFIFPAQPPYQGACCIFIYSSSAQEHGSHCMLPSLKAVPCPFLAAFNKPERRDPQ
jgi:hypothetical protein